MGRKSEYVSDCCGCEITEVSKDKKPKRFSYSPPGKNAGNVIYGGNARMNKYEVSFRRFKKSCRSAGENLNDECGIYIGTKCTERNCPVLKSLKKVEE